VSRYSAIFGHCGPGIVTKTISGCWSQVWCACYPCPSSFETFMMLLMKQLLLASSEGSVLVVAHRRREVSFGAIFNFLMTSVTTVRSQTLF
jgi:hypothetical protein